MVNSCLDKIGETPVTRLKLQSKREEGGKTVMGDIYSDQTGDEGEMVRQLKEKFSTAERSEKIQSLTVYLKAGLFVRFN